MATRYHLDRWVAAHQDLLTALAAGAGTDTVARWLASDDTVLAQAVLDMGASAVDPASGDITFVVDTQEAAADATGTAAVFQVLDRDGVVQLELDCQEGSSAVAGYMTMNTLSIAAGVPVEILSFSVPAGGTV